MLSFSPLSAKAKQAKKEPPTRIRSDIIDIKRKSQTINFINNVVVEKGEDSMLANKMKVIYEEKTSKSEDAQIERIDAFGDVKIFSEEFVASSELGHYEPKKNRFILEKDVIVNNGTSIASGEKFIYNLITKKGKFVGNSGETSIMNDNKNKRITVVIGNDAKMEKKDDK